jgi:hypothetical protein
MKKEFKQTVIGTVKMAIPVLLLAGFVVAGAWTDAPANPPANNVAAPLNVGTDNQTKLGSLILNASTVSPDTFGLDVFGDSRFFGRVSSDTDVCVESAAETICLTDLYNLTKNYGVQTSTSCTLYYDSMKDIGVTARPGWETPNTPIPAGCYSDGGCVIRQEIYSRKGLHRALVVDFYQDAATGIWSSTYNRSGSRRNGNATSENVVAPIGRKDLGWVLIRDDRARVANVGANKGSFYVETEANRLSFYDTWSAYGHKVYFCAANTVLTEDEEDLGDGTDE